jgi:stress response protein SCP2
MAINLTKGQTIVLDKSEYNLSRLVMGLGWDVAEKKRSGLGGIFGGGKRANFDLDGYAILLQANETLPKQNYQEDVIYYGHLTNREQTVCHSGDNLTGEGAGDDEQITLFLNNIPEKYEKVILGVSIYKASERQQDFGMVNNAFVRAVDASGKEIAKYSLSGEATYHGKISMLMGEVYRHQGQWKFRALGNPLDVDLAGVIKLYAK